MKIPVTGFTVASVCKNSARLAGMLCIAAGMAVADAQAQTATAASPALSAAPTSGTTAPVALSKFANNKIVLTAEQSTGGNLLRNSDGSLIGVTLDKGCSKNFKTPADACIEWKLAEPLPAGWWHGVAQSNFRSVYSNQEISFTLVNAQKPGVVMAPNYVSKGKDAPQQFEFWIYSSSPAESFRVKPTADLWMWNNTWPVSQITLEHIQPTALTPADAVTLDLPVAADGTISLPMQMPTGNWIMSGVTNIAGTVTLEAANKKSIQVPITPDQWKRLVPRGANFYLDIPLSKVTSNTPNLYKNILLVHNVTRASTPLVSEGTLITTVDPSKTESAQLEMIGSNLTGEAPVFPLLPGGQKTAVVTTWDDGKETDLRLAEILNRLGYHPSFFLNQNSPAIQFLDKLEAMNVEVGSHCYHHPSLYVIPPQRALEECVEGRKFLETALKHPVISFAYPMGYTAAYDMDGDYVLRAVKAAGYWSGRTTRTKAETVESYQELLTMDPDGFFGNAKDLERIWQTTVAKEGGIFYFWGHSWQIGKTDEQWKKFEDFAAQFAKQPNTWYPSQGELSLWIWARKNVQLAVAGKSPMKVVVKVSRPWLHPYLSAKCPLSFKVPAGVAKVVWKGKEIPVSNGFVDLTW